MIRSLRLLPYLTLLIVFSAPAWAKGKADKWEIKERAAKKACIVGDVRKGINILGDLYVETDDITFVFNQGRCYQQNHRWEEALDWFSEYVRKSPTLAGDDLAEVEKHIADCKSHLPPTPTAMTQPTLAPAASAPIIGFTARRDESPKPAPSRVPTLPPAGVVPARAEPRTSPGSGLRVTGMAVGAIGLAAVAAGIVLDLKTHSIVNDVYTNGYDPEKLSSRDTYETWGWVSFGVGAAALVAGTTMYLLGWSAAQADSTGTQVSLAPVVGRSGGLLLFQGRIP